MIEIDDRSEQQHLRRIERAARHIAKLPAAPKRTATAPIVPRTTRPCVYRIALTPQGREQRRFFVQSFDDDQIAQHYALGRNLALTNDDIYIVVRRAA